MSESITLEVYRNFFIDLQRTWASRVISACLCLVSVVYNWFLVVSARLYGCTNKWKLPVRQCGNF